MNESSLMTVGYAYNGYSLAMMWETPYPNQKIDYKVYLAKEDGKFYFAGNSTYNLFIHDDEGLTACYIEMYNKNGRYLSKLENIKIQVNRNDRIDIVSVKSYNGVTLNWSDQRSIGRYHLMRKSENGYQHMFSQEMFQITLKNMPEGETVRIIQYNEKGWPIAVSEDFVFSSADFYNPIPEKKELSVVIPVYNNENFLSLCVDSVLASVMTDLEIIIVDDGSVDNTPAIADWYQENYPEKVRVIHTPNQGAGLARNEGIKAAEGKYIAFADSDDFVCAGMYSALYNKIVENDCDFSICDYFMLQIGSNDDLIANSLNIDPDEVHPADELLLKTYSEYYMSVSMCDKIYKTSLVREHLIPSNVYEDVAWTPVFASYAKNFCYINSMMYCYNRTVNLAQPTLSNIMGTMTPEQRAAERLSSYKYILEKGNPEKRDYLMLVVVRLTARQFLEMTDATEEITQTFIDLMMEYKDEINSNELIAQDTWLVGRLKESCKKWNFSMD